MACPSCFSDDPLKLINLSPCTAEGAQLDKRYAISDHKCAKIFRYITMLEEILLANQPSPLAQHHIVEPIKRLQLRKQNMKEAKTYSLLRQLSSTFVSAVSQELDDSSLIWC